jgi:hypothetical protein
MELEVENGLIVVDQLRSSGVEFSPGLTDSEIGEVENDYGFTFPPDLRGLIQYALPISQGFVDWRDASPDEIWTRMDWPVEGMCFDVQHSGFWMEAWGPRPERLADAFAVVIHQVAQAPRMIPVYSHRYLPAEPCMAGNPIFSIHQTDIIHYGYDLADYFANEFHAASAEGDTDTPHRVATKPRPIRFWDPVMNGELDAPVSESLTAPVVLDASERVARFLLSNSTSEAERIEARRSIQQMGIDPDAVRYVRP